ncbi:MAG: DegT/DnrJ/EryC1/StrS family aminotransferase [Hyphomonadaceae bacterium]|nr:DegT/DnrJ/EryC1/StrS family aminotransferase [Hyphomonadaceae bacterium]
MLTRDRNLYERLNSLHFHGWGSRPFDHEHIGMNSRLGSFQAAMLLEKLKLSDDKIRVRNRIADRYSEHFIRHRVRIPALSGTACQPGRNTQSRLRIATMSRSACRPGTLPVPLTIRCRHTCKQPMVAAPAPSTDCPIRKPPCTARWLCSRARHLSETDQDSVIKAVLGSL